MANVDILKALGIPVPGVGPTFSPGVLEAAPDLSVDTPHTAYEVDANQRLKELLGLNDRSPEFRQQEADLAEQDKAKNEAAIDEIPSVAAMRDRELQDKLKLAGEPARVQGASALAVEQAKNAAAADAARQQHQQMMELMGMSGPNANSTPSLRPSINTKGEVSFTSAPLPKLNAQQQQIVDAAHQVNDLASPLLQKFSQKYPGIESDPSKYGHWTDALTSTLGKGFYSYGGMTANDPIIQDAAAIQAWGMRALSSGRINRAMMDVINAHLPQPGFSAGANYDRLNRLLTDILPAQLQGMKEGMGPNPYDLGTPGGGNDPYADENYQPR